MSDESPQHPDLERLGAQLDKARRKEAARQPAAPPAAMGIAFRFTTEMVAALLVGGALGWALDWLFGTRPIFLVLMFVLGAAAGMRNVMRAAKELNEQAAAAQKQAPSVADDDEES